MQHSLTTKVQKVKNVIVFWSFTLFGFIPTLTSTRATFASRGEVLVGEGAFFCLSLLIRSGSV